MYDRLIILPIQHTKNLKIWIIGFKHKLNIYLGENYK